MPEADIALPIVAEGPVLRIVLPLPWFTLPAQAREVFRRKVAANDPEPADEPPAAA